MLSEAICHGMFYRHLLPDDRVPAPDPSAPMTPLGKGDIGSLTRHAAVYWDCLAGDVAGGVGA